MIGHVNANGSITLSCMVGDGPSRFLFSRTFYGYTADVEDISSDNNTGAYYPNLSRWGESRLALRAGRRIWVDVDGFGKNK